MITHKHWLALILLLYLLLGVAYSWVVPLGEAPDEVDHFLYVRYLLEERTFPVMHPVAADNETMEANQPPLFYLLNAAVTAPFPMTAAADLPLNACFTFDPDDGGRAHFYLHDAAEASPFAPDYLAFRVARLFSVLLGAVAVWLAYRLGRQLVPDDGRVGLLAAGILAFNPQFLFMMASVNNDVLTAVLGAAILTFSIQAALTPSPRLFALLGGLVGLGLLTKFALLAFWPLPVLAALWPVIRETLSVIRNPLAVIRKPLAEIRNPKSEIRNPKSALPNLLLIFTLPLLIAGWWYVRAYLLYGDPLAWDVHLQAKGAEVLRTAPLTLADLRDFVVIHFQSYWAWFGWLKIKAPAWVYGLLALFGATAVIGLTLLFRDALRNPKSALRNSQSAISLLFTFLAVAAIYASLLRYILTINWSGYQGRLAFAAAAPIAALLALGWWGLARQRGKGAKWHKHWLLALPVVGLLLLAIGSLAQLANAFARPALFVPPVAWTRVCQATAVSFYVEAYDAPAVILPGETLPLAVGGYGLTAGQGVAQGALLAGDDLVATTAVFPFAWLPQTPITFTLPLDVPAQVAPARARLLLYLDGELVELGWLKLAPREPVTAVPTHPLVAYFGDEVALLGYDLRQEAKQLHLTTYWQALRPMTTDYTLFAHLLDAEGALLAQTDAPPQGGRYPTSVWDVGEVVVDERVIARGDGETAVAIAIGLYHQVTQERLPAKLEGQPSAPDSALRLPLIHPSNVNP